MSRRSNSNNNSTLQQQQKAAAAAEQLALHKQNQVWIRSLQRNDMDIAAVMDLNLSLHILVQKIFKLDVYHEFLLLELGRGYQYRLAPNGQDRLLQRRRKSRVGDDDIDKRATTNETTATKEEQEEKSTTKEEEEEDGVTTKSNKKMEEQERSSSRSAAAAAALDALLLANNEQVEAPKNHNDEEEDEDDIHLYEPIPMSVMPYELQEVCVDFLLRMKLRRKLLSRIARRSMRIASSMDAAITVTATNSSSTTTTTTSAGLSVLEPPPPPKYGDLRLACISDTIETHFTPHYQAMDAAWSRIILAREQQQEESWKPNINGGTTTTVTTTSNDNDGVAEEEDDKEEEEKSRLIDRDAPARKNDPDSTPEDTDDPMDIVASTIPTEQTPPIPTTTTSSSSSATTIKGHNNTVVDDDPLAADYNLLKDYKDAYEKVVVVVKSQKHPTTTATTQTTTGGDGDDPISNAVEAVAAEMNVASSDDATLQKPLASSPANTGKTTTTATESEEEETTRDELIVVQYPILEPASEQQQEEEEDYQKIPSGVGGIGATQMNMSTAEKQVEYKRWQTAVLSRIPEQPTYHELGLHHRVFYLEQRRQRLLRQIRKEQDEAAVKMAQQQKQQRNKAVKEEMDDDDDDDDDAKSIDSMDVEEEEAADTLEKNDADIPEDNVKKEKEDNSGEMPAVDSSVKLEDSSTAIAANDEDDALAEQDTKASDGAVAPVDTAARDCNVVEDSAMTTRKSDQPSKGDDLETTPTPKDDVSTTRDDLANSVPGSEEWVLVDKDDAASLDHPPPSDGGSTPAAPSNSAKEGAPMDVEVEDSSVPTESHEAASSNVAVDEGGTHHVAIGMDDDHKSSSEQKDAADHVPKEGDSELDANKSRLETTTATNMDAGADDETGNVKQTAKDVDGDRPTSSTLQAEDDSDMMDIEDNDSSIKKDGDTEDRDRAPPAEESSKITSPEIGTSKEEEDDDEPGSEKVVTTDATELDTKKPQEQPEVVAPLPKIVRPISLAAIPSFYEQDLKRIKLVHADLMSSSMREHAIRRLEEATREFNQALKNSMELADRRTYLQAQINTLVNELKTQSDSYQIEYRNQIQLAARAWNVGRVQFEQNKLNRMLPSRCGRVPLGTQLTQHYRSRPDRSGLYEAVSDCVADIVDCVEGIAKGMVHNERYQPFVMPAPPVQQHPQLDPQHQQRAKQMEAAKRNELNALTLRLRTSEGDRLRAWRKMLKTKAEFDMPHHHVSSSGAIKIIPLDQHNVGTLPLPTLNIAAQQRVPAEFITAHRSQLATYTPKPPPPLPDSDPSQPNYYSTSRARARLFAAAASIIDDRTTADSTAPKGASTTTTAETGHTTTTTRPVGRNRKGMEWDTSLGEWIPTNPDA